MDLRNCTYEENTCKYYSKGFCYKLSWPCPSTVRYDKNNDNNVPCDLAGYTPVNKTDNKNP